MYVKLDKDNGDCLNETFGDFALIVTKFFFSMLFYIKL